MSDERLKRVAEPPSPGAAEAARPEDGPDRADNSISRRGALKVIAAGAALGAAASCAPEDAARSAESAHEALSGFEPLPPSNPLAAGTAADPDLLAPVVPWEMVLTDEEMRLVAALSDVIIPADERSPSASEVGVPDYVNEFVSAPAHTEQLTRLRGGLAWLNREARERFGAGDFPALTVEQQHEICDEIRFEPDAPAELKPQARFFDAFRDMVSTGFWTTEEGMRDLGYVGNIPLPSFDGPPPEVLEQLGLSGEDLA
ncbi:MAG: gluconate 2-dehydrogenase subunit 3 family protein [Gemmatimonadetes bacterium]|nr:gluconate 2-dehydrogenase subunit 3 family protein [Gemmatimonadota bacterium]MYB08099.1 gluconate 2-dehydrogenase subunit 3 family protein [Gemmatimonadota bacterium]MYE16145.1 gluconate 2-dehydrogenase subunit 3 family protein [Gemmatimonadota bacterium]MYG23169.1 gluconate 2-dehydrogenase subunit 3 family protein [Gemmatimonadota bacterium]MYJ38749.1 gluconate 2-dehydrogenase subunit 3 family protein [Gemmatimonadota bacterium]